MRRVAAAVAALGFCAIFVWDNPTPAPAGSVPASTTKTVGRYYSLITTQTLPVADIMANPEDGKGFPLN